MDFDKLEILKKLKETRMLSSAIPFISAMQPAETSNCTIEHFREQREIDNPNWYKGKVEEAIAKEDEEAKKTRMERKARLKELQLKVAQLAADKAEEENPGGLCINPLKLPNVGETKILIDGVLYNNISNIDWFVINEDSEYPVVGSMTFFIGRPEDNIVPKQFDIISCITANYLLETLENNIVGVRIFGTGGGVNQDSIIMEKTVYFEAKDVIETASPNLN
jgi:hypothetical protein